MNQNQAEISVNHIIPVKPGMGLHDDGMQYLHAAAHKLAADGPIYEGDVSGWDWSVQEFDFEFDLQRRIHLNHSEGTVFARILRAHFYCMQRKVMLLSDGTLIQQMIPGIIPSGWYNTSSTNSNIRCYNHYVLSLEQGTVPRIIANGDDSVEGEIANPIERYEGLGKTLKMFNMVGPDDFEFCSNKFGPSGFAVPTNVDKHLVTFLNVRPINALDCEERLTVLRYDLRHHPDLDKLIDLVYQSGWMTSYIKLQVCIGTTSESDQNSKRVLNKMPRDCTDPPCFSSSGALLLNSPTLSLWNPIRMTKKSKQTNKQNLANMKRLTLEVIKDQSKLRNKKAQLTGNALTVGGTYAEKYLGPGHVSSIAKYLGAGIGSIFGSGNYAVTGPKPKYNILSGQVPRFSTSKATNIVSHREYLGEITGTTAFTNTVYPINPGMSQTFPWLSQIAASYQQYKFHGLIFEFRPLITDFVTSGAPGVICLTTNYDANKPSFVTRQEAENAEFATSTKPTMGLGHFIELDPKEVQNNLYNVRTGVPAAGTDLRFYDYGNTQFITQNNPNQVLGELWVSYVVEFFKPTLSSSNDIVLAEGLKTSRSLCNSSSPFGSVQVNRSGLLSFTATTSTITVTNASIGTKYQWLATWNAATSVIITSFVNGGITGLTLFNSGASTNTNNGSGTISQTICVVGVATSTTITFQITASTIVGTCTSDVILSVLDDTIV